MNFNILITQLTGRATTTTPGYIQPVTAQRIPVVTNVVFNQADPGGFMDAAFTIPAIYGGRLSLNELRSGLYKIWIYQGITPVYYGMIDRATPGATNGSIDVGLMGHYSQLYTTRMREAFVDSDLSKWVVAHGSVGSGSVQVTSKGSLQIALPKDHSFSNGDYIAADYYLFNEAVGTRDDKRITGFDLTAGASTFEAHANLVFRVYGMATPTTGSGSWTLLHSDTTGAPFSRAETSRAGFADNVADWPNIEGYRLIRVGIWATGAVTALAADRNVRLDTIRVSSDANHTWFPTATGPPHTTDMVRSIWNQSDINVNKILDLPQAVLEQGAGETGGIATISNASPAVVTLSLHGFRANQQVVFTNNGDVLPTPLVFGTAYFVMSTGLTANTFQISATAGGAAINTSSAGSGIHIVTGQGFAGFQVTGNIVDSTTAADGITFDQWTSPGEILDAMTAMDGYHAGMWFPATRVPFGTGLSVTSARQWWHWAPPELVYAAWGDLRSPDYQAYLVKGADWQPDSQPQELISAVYVNYTNLSGRQNSLYVEDATLDNWLYSQGLHKAEDWTIDPAVSDSTATTLAQQYLMLRRQPTLSGSLVIRGDKPGALQHTNGEYAKLSTVRTGTIVRIPDAEMFRVGRVTQASYTARTASDPEILTLALNNPAALDLDAQLAALGRRARKQRRR